MDGYWHRPVGVRGWTHVVFRRERDGVRRVMSLDEMLAHLDAWDRTADRRMSQRRIARALRAMERRLLADRRAMLMESEQRRRMGDVPLADAEVATSAPKTSALVESDVPLPLTSEAGPSRVGEASDERMGTPAAPSNSARHAH